MQDTVRNKLTWLHISDIHFHPKTEWRDSIARSGLLTYLKAAFDREDSLRPDLIFCTGDIAYGETGCSPLGDQYGQAKTFFDKLLLVCGRNDRPLSKHRLFVVPGNHDVNRDNINSYAQATLTRWAETASDHALIINQAKKHFGGSTNMRNSSASTYLTNRMWMEGIGTPMSSKLTG